MALEIALMIVGVLIFFVGIFSAGVSLWLTVKYFKYNRRENSAGLTGMEIARSILDANGLDKYYNYAFVPFTDADQDAIIDMVYDSLDD